MTQRGFSLIEIMVAVAVGIILLMAGLPAMTGMIAGLRVRSTGDEILAALQVARAEAMKRNQNVTFSLDAEEGAGWSVLLDADQSVLSGKDAAAGGKVLVQGDLDSMARFNNLGLRVAPTGGDLSFTISNPGAGACQPSGTVRCLRVVVRVGGQMRLCDPQRPAGDPQSCDFGAGP